ncbi:MAG: peptidoglycan-binding protein [Candidatus Entotheonellia bacterium]
MRNLIVILAAGLLFLGPVVAAAQSQSGTPGGQTPSRTPSGGQIQSEPSPGSMAPGTQSQTPDTEQVRKAQEKLKAAGFDPGPTDGNLGPQTKEALRDYQKARGLPQTGMLDNATQQALLATGAPGRGTTPGGSPGGSMGGGSGSESPGGAIRR